MEKKNYSYIGDFTREKIANNVKVCNEYLARFQSLLTANGETLEDARRYQSEGWDADIKAKRKEVREWMEKHEMPSYLRADYEEKAVQSLGLERLQYLQRVASALPIRCDGKEIDLTKDIDVKNGQWVLSDANVTAMLESKRYTLSDEEMSDLELCLLAGDAIRKVKERGIDTADLEWFNRAKDTETLAQCLMRSYKGDADPNAYLKAIGVI
ncbi:MAG: hypothetical protein J1E97_01210 [Muribaculaceae bacterium]|nr:hypothetical protein [Muribaculaceae bacterium]